VPAHRRLCMPASDGNRDGTCMTVDQSGPVPAHVGPFQNRQAVNRAVNIVIGSLIFDRLPSPLLRAQPRRQFEKAPQALLASCIGVAGSCRPQCTVSQSNAIESNGTYKVSHKRKTLKTAKIKQPQEAQHLSDNAAIRYFIAAAQCTTNMEPNQAPVVRLPPAPCESNQCGIGLLRQ
jgi:hypothetical protein